MKFWLTKGLNLQIILLRCNLLKVLSTIVVSKFSMLEISLKLISCIVIPITSSETFSLDKNYT